MDIAPGQEESPVNFLKLKSLNQTKKGFFAKKHQGEVQMKTENPVEATLSSDSLARKIV